VSEYTRRTASVTAGTYNGTWTATPTYVAYTTAPAAGNKVQLEHMSKYFTDAVNFPASGKTYTVAQFDVIKTVNISDSITYVTSLMNANIVK
jgi:hypothetical protein